MKTGPNLIETWKFKVFETKTLNTSKQIINQKTSSRKQAANQHTLNCKIEILNRILMRSIESGERNDKTYGCPRLAFMNLGGSVARIV